MTARANGAGKRRPGAWRAFAALAAADIGLKLSYMPLLSILLPAKAQALDPASAPFVLSAVSLAGAAVASVVNLAVGWLGDRTGPAHDRRRWVGIGAAAICASYLMLGLAREPFAFLASVLMLQVSINVTISPLTVLIADRFFRRPHGFVVGAGGASQPMAGFLGAGLTAALIPFGPAAYLAIGVVTAALITPFVLLSRPGAGPPLPPAVEPAAEPPAEREPLSLRRDLARLWVWRFSLALTAALSGPYALFRLRDALGGAGATRVVALAVDVSALTLLASCAHLAAAVSTAWAVSRGLRRREAAVLAALVLAAGMIAFVAARGPIGFVVAFALMGFGTGASQVSDAQLALALLPSRTTLGRDIGLLNLAYTAPQMLAPLLAMATPGVRGGHVEALFAVAALSSLAAAAIAGGMDRDLAAPLFRRRARDAAATQSP